MRESECSQVDTSDIKDSLHTNWINIHLHWEEKLCRHAINAHISFIMPIYMFPPINYV